AVFRPFTPAPPASHAVAAAFDGVADIALGDHLLTPQIGDMGSCVAVGFVGSMVDLALTAVVGRDKTERERGFTRLVTGTIFESVSFHVMYHTLRHALPKCRCMPTSLGVLQPPPSVVDTFIAAAAATAVSRTLFCRPRGGLSLTRRSDKHYPPTRRTMRSRKKTIKAWGAETAQESIGAGIKFAVFETVVSTLMPITL
ncbi:hypothetical protein KIPB_009861, partial [Kipferlia bialata]